MCIRDRLYTDRQQNQFLKRRLQALLITDSLKRRAALDELRDYRALRRNADDELWALHAELERIRVDQTANYSDYDYGNGYYYQSMPALTISGFRDTQARVSALQLSERLQGKRVLDIGSNTGFVLLSVASVLSSGTGVEFNPYLVETAKAAAKHMQADNTEFIANSFEEVELPQGSFDVVLSLANHSTYDGNTQQTIDSYFQRIFGLLDTGGQLIFESHPPQIEPADKYKSTLETIEKYFAVEEQPAIDLPGFLDKNRRYVIARRS